MFRVLITALLFPTLLSAQSSEQNARYEAEIRNVTALFEVAEQVGLPLEREARRYNRLGRLLRRMGVSEVRSGELYGGQTTTDWEGVVRLDGVGNAALKVEASSCPTSGDLYSVTMELWQYDPSVTQALSQILEGYSENMSSNFSNLKQISASRPGRLISQPRVSGEFSTGYIVLNISDTGRGTFRASIQYECPAG